MSEKQKRAPRDHHCSCCGKMLSKKTFEKHQKIKRESARADRWYELHYSKGYYL